MKNVTYIIIGLALCALCAGAGDIRDIELVSNVTTSTPVTVTAKPGVNGNVLSVAFDVASASTGAVQVLLVPAQTSMDSRTIASTNPITADVWMDPSDSGSRPYAFTDSDTFSVTVTNLAVATKTYRTVIRVETK